MRSLDEVVAQFTPVGNLGGVAKQRIYKLGLAFQELATEIIDLAPENASRTIALNKLLEAKFLATQAVTHDKVQPSSTTKLEPTENPRSDKANQKKSA